MMNRAEQKMNTQYHSGFVTMKSSVSNVSTFYIYTSNLNKPLMSLTGVTIILKLERLLSISCSKFVVVLLRGGGETNRWSVL